MSDPYARPTMAPDAEAEQNGQQQGDEQARIAQLVETLSKEAAEYKDRMLRTLAEMENMRKRTDREVADSRVYGISNFARDILASPTTWTAPWARSTRTCARRPMR